MATNIGRRRIMDHRESARHYEFAADRGYAEGRRDPGILCADGRDVTKDDREAARLFKLAADQGNATGQANLGVFYESGRGCRKDDREAARLYKRAADQGNAAGRPISGCSTSRAVAACRRTTARPRASSNSPQMWSETFQSDPEGSTPSR
jgi:TPR repeat protein